MIKYIYHLIFCFILAALFTGCAGNGVIPERLENQVNHKIQFTEVQDSPDLYKGELMVVGGEVLSIERLEDQTKIVVLQLPLDDDLVPADHRTMTKGRFIALSKDMDLDPAVFEHDTAVTLVGEVVGSETIQVDKDEKTVPLYAIKDLTIWDEARFWRAEGYENPAYFYSGYRPFGYPYY
jgi:outer membrane lipoprotein